MHLIPKPQSDGNNTDAYTRNPQSNTKLGKR